jgi:hypothetical protein
MSAQHGCALDVDGLAKTIVRLTRTNKALHTRISSAPFITQIMHSLPKSAAVCLVKKLAKMPAINQNILTFLKMLPRSGALELSYKLAKRGIIQNSPEIDEWRKTIRPINGRHLFNAATSENPDIVKIAELLKTPDIDIDWRKRSDRRKTALMQASVQGNTEIVDLLLAAGADVHKRDKQGSTTLIYANFNSDAIVNRLLAAGAKINALGSVEFLKI